MFFLKQQTQIFTTASAVVRAYGSRSGVPRTSTFAKLKEGAALSGKIPTIPGHLFVLRRLGGEYSNLTNDQLAEKYASLSKEERKPIVEARQKAREEKKAFITGLSTKQLENILKYKEAKESGTFVQHHLKDLIKSLPKSSPSAYNLFVQEASGKRAEGTSHSLRAIADQFNVLDGQSKQKYQALAKAAQEAYPAKFQAWKESLSADDLKLLKTNAGRNALGKTNYQKIFGKRPMSGMNLFVKEYFAKHPVSAGERVNETFKAAVDAYSQLNDAEKASYKSA